MPLIYVMGVNGSGKSTVRKELSARGYQAHELDEAPGVGFYNKRTGKKTPLGARTKAWYDQHEWIMPREKAEEFAARAKNELIFLCGGVHNEKDLWDLFDVAIYLDIDEPTVLKRVRERSKGTGKAPAELAELLRWHAIAKDIYLKRGAKIVNSAQPIKKVVDDVLSFVPLVKD
ncbi:MAG TPA: AAA family ATPase [Patescibacteria group bacterium]|jgi:adenylate kinase family enzyme